MAKDLLARGELAAAEVEAQKAVALNRDSDDAHNTLGLVYLLRAQRTLALIEREDCIDGVDVESVRLEADALMRKADEQFRIATELAPDFGDAWQNRGVVAMYHRDWSLAVTHLERALGNLARVNELLARTNLGWAYLQAGDLGRAASELRQATSGRQYFCLGSFRLASVYFARKEWEKARDRLKPVLDDPKLCPPLVEAQLLGGQTLVRLRDLDGARKAFSTCVEMAPRSCQARECQKALTELSSVSRDGTTP